MPPGMTYFAGCVNDCIGLERRAQVFADQRDHAIFNQHIRRVGF